MHTNSNINSSFHIFTTGTYTLCLSAALLKQLKSSNYHNVSVMHYEHNNEMILECEKWLCNLFGYTHLGNLGDLHIRANGLLGNKLISRVLKVPFFKTAWQNWGINNLSYLSKNKTQNFIVPLRPHLSDVLLSNLFPFKNIHYVPDGYLMGFPTDFSIPKIWKLTGIKNPYSYKMEKNVYTPKNLKERMSQFSSEQTLIDDGISLVSSQINNHPDVKNWQNKIVTFTEKKECTCIILQCFSLFNWLDPFEELSLYMKIIKRELETSDNNILVKHHPRDNLAKITLLKNLLSDLDVTRIRFMEPDIFSTLPIEFFIESFNINTLCGISSTVLLSHGFTNNIKSKLYSADWLPKKLKDEIHAISKSIGVNPINL